ncbi:hypothetical protein [Teredinibacter turnerae]|uniref:hypothetical protein n=1 Tax=Teredinibacter turnerae TaxID=2426 RepID=UPI0005F7A3E2|nr:hypothetical protein [Teredinibacter turnerae]
MKFILIIFVLFFAGCSFEPNPKLSDGYQYFRLFGSVHSIAKPNGDILIYGDVDEVKEVRDLIVGRRIRIDPPLGDMNTFDSQRYGYFIFNKTSGDLKTGMSQNEWDKVLNLASPVAVQAKKL